MSEWALVWLVILRLLLIGSFVMCYVIGGRGPKWVRRWLGGIGFGLGLIGLSLIDGTFHWILLGVPPLLSGVLCIGYGGTTLMEKVIRRAIRGMAMGAISLLVAFFCAPAAIFLAVSQFLLASIGTILLGVTNPVVAVHEEALIALVSVLCLPFLV